MTITVSPCLEPMLFLEIFFFDSENLGSVFLKTGQSCPQPFLHDIRKWEAGKGLLLHSCGPHHLTLPQQCLIWQRLPSFPWASLAHIKLYLRIKDYLEIDVSLQRLKQLKSAHHGFICPYCPWLWHFATIWRKPLKENHTSQGLNNFYMAFQVSNQKILVISRPGQRRKKVQQKHRRSG